MANAYTTPFSLHREVPSPQVWTWCTGYGPQRALLAMELNFSQGQVLHSLIKRHRWAEKWKIRNFYAIPPLLQELRILHFSIMKKVPGL